LSLVCNGKACNATTEIKTHVWYDEIGFCAQGIDTILSSTIARAYVVIERETQS
jgi:hypothetical protein